MDYLLKLLDAIGNEGAVLAGGWHLLLFLLAATAGAVWWFRGTIERGKLNELRGEMAGLNAQIGNLNGQIGGLNQQVTNVKQQLETRDERLKFANEKFEAILEEKKRLAADLAQLKQRVIMSPDWKVLEGISGSAESRVLRLDNLLNDLKTTIAPPGGVTYTMDVPKKAPD